MSGCRLCPRECGANRDERAGYCGAFRYPNIARAALHHWEEPEISGKNGSGTIFFSGCNLGCIFCQNKAINHTLIGQMADGQRLAAIMLRLQAARAHNINLVSPAPFVEALAEAIPLAREQGLAIPIVYNTNAYEKPEAIAMMRGLVDIYLPDMKYVSAGIAAKYSGAADYFTYASKAIEEMFSQAGLLARDENGLARSGVIIRHLVLPGSVDETRRVLDYLAATFPKELDISLMGQYAPNGAGLPRPLDRGLMKREYARAIDHALSLGLVNIRIQSLDSASMDFTPDFDGFVI